MKMRIGNWRTGGRLVWAIFAKDLRDVLRNKNTISVLISGLFIVVMYRMLPLITRGGEPPRVWIYDEGQSGLAAFLENSDVVDAWAGAESLGKIEELLREADRPELGLVIPADFDRRLEAGEEVALQGYLMSWVSPADAAELREAVEAEVARNLGEWVPIRTEGNILHLLPDSTGPGLQASLAAVFLLTMIGASLVPHLMMAEKQERTLEVLLASPASEAHVIAAKALTGMVYCLIGGGIALAINRDIVMHWWLAILGLVCFSLFTISLGLALGIQFETRAQLSVWTWVIFIPLFIPAIAVLLQGLVPDGIIQVMRFTPTVAFSTVWRHSFAQTTSPAAPLGWLMYLLIWAGAVLGLAVWLMRRRDRRTESRRVAGAAPAAQGGDTPVEGYPLPRHLLRGTPPLGSVTRGARSGPRIIWAIFAKDMREALSNKLLLSILIGTALVILNGSALPLMLEMQWKPAAVVYDEGRSTLIRGLMGEDDFRIRLAESREELEDIVTSGPGTWIGLIIPEDFDQRAGDPTGIQLQGYAAHWADEEKLRQAQGVFERQLGLATWSAVQIDLAGSRLYPGPDAGGQISLNLLTAMIAMTAIGVALVPLLIVEEKEAHTLEALLVSPARFSEVMFGKALVGAAYCLLAVGVALLFNRVYIVHWWIALLAGMLSALFAVSLGMLVGVLAENPTSAAVWASPIILILLVPTLAQLLTGSALPEFMRALFRWTPGSVMINLFRLSMAGEVPSPLLWANLAALGAMAAAAYLLVGWRMRSLYR
jgi:ABC-2 type transport system permease protein